MEKKVHPKTWKFILITLVLIVLISIPYFSLSPYFLSLVEMFLIWALFAMSLDLLVGYCGLTSLGHAAFFGVAAYFTGILTVKYGFGTFSVVIISLLSTIVLAIVVGLVTSHLKGVSFMMVTLAISQVVWGLAMQWMTMTGGDNGVSGIPKPHIDGASMSAMSFYYLTLVVFVACAVLLFFFIQSPFGLAVKGIKQTESRMRILGYNVWFYKFLLQTISAFFAAIAGILWAYYIGFVGPTDVSLLTSSEALLMVLTGGAGTLYGSIVGALIIVFTQDIVSTFTERWSLIMGVLYVIVVLFLPGGFVALFRTIKEKKFMT